MLSLGNEPHMDELKRQFDQLLGRGDLKGALEVLGQAAPDKSNEIILTQARLSGLNQNIRLGIISHSDAQINKNQITAAVMSISSDVFSSASNSSVVMPNNEREIIEDNPVNRDTKIYFSYSWGDDKSEEGRQREVLVDALYNSLDKEGFDVRRDKVHVGYGESIKRFMEDLGENPLNIVFLSDKYFKSFYTMFELTEIARNSSDRQEIFQSRVLPVHVEPIDFFNNLGRLGGYLEYWNAKEKELSDFLAKYKDQVNSGFYERYESTRTIKRKFSELYNWLGDMNASSSQLISKNEFEMVKDTIRERLSS